MNDMGIYILIAMIIAVIIQTLYFLYLRLSCPPSPTTSKTTLKGREGFVVKEIDPEDISGKIKITSGNKIWSATADEEIDEGTKVKITEAKGVHVSVEKIE